MAELSAMTDTQLEAALVELGASIAYPRPGPGLVARVTERLGRAGAARPVPWWRRLEWGWLRPSPNRPLRRALVLALVALFVLAAIAAAIGLGVPGIRIVFGPAPTSAPSASISPGTSIGSAASPTPTPSGALGSGMGLGAPIALVDAPTQAGFVPRLPAGIGQPAQVYVREGRLTLVWAPSPRLPLIGDTRLGLLVTEFRGQVDPGYYQKITNLPGTSIEPIAVNGNPGYWFSGEPHQLFYVDANGQHIDETRRPVGQALIWADGELTFRLETSLSKDEAIRLAESMR